MTDSTTTQSDETPWLPAPDESNAPFFEGLAQDTLRLQCCADCGVWTFPLRERCQACGKASLVWRDASGRGKIYSHAVLRREYHPRHAGRLPLTLAWVDLAEGVRMATNIVDHEAGEVRVGAAVEVAFEPIPGGGKLPVFRLVP